MTHFNPDLDAVASIWIIKKFLPGWKKARLGFVPAGETYKNQPADSHSEILHVDTGLGECDHHQRGEFICSAKLCWQKCQMKKVKFKMTDLEAIERLLEIVCQVDHGRNISWPQPENDRYAFFLKDILEGLNSIYQEDERTVDFGLIALDGVLVVLKDKIRAEETLKGPGVIEFQTKWGKAIGVITGNNSVLEEGEKMGYSLVVKKDSRRAQVRIYARWDKKVDLTDVYQKLKMLDPQATWFLHPSKCLLLNGSTRNPKMRPTKLSLREIVKVFQ